MCCLGLRAVGRICGQFSNRSKRPHAKHAVMDDIGNDADSDDDAVVDIALHTCCCRDAQLLRPQLAGEGHQSIETLPIGNRMTTVGLKGRV